MVSTSFIVSTTVIKFGLIVWIGRNKPKVVRFITIILSHAFEVAIVSIVASLASAAVKYNDTSEIKFSQFSSLLRRIEIFRNIF